MRRRAGPLRAAWGPGRTLTWDRRHRRPSGMDCAPLERLHCIEGDRVAGHLDLARRAYRYLAHGVLAALSVSLDVDDHALTLGEMLADHHIGHRLERPQRLAPPTDERAEV